MELQEQSMTERTMVYITDQQINNLKHKVECNNIKVSEVLEQIKEEKKKYRELSK